MMSSVAASMNERLRILLSSAGWCAALGVFVASILSNPMSAYTSRDSGIFLYIGSLVLKGRIPYVAAWENKGPLLYYIDALGLFLGNGSRWGVWLMEFLFLLAGAVIGYLLIRRLMGNVAAWIGSFLWVTAAGSLLQGGNFSEQYSLPFAFMAAYGFLRSLEYPRGVVHLILIGVSLGYTMLLRPNNAGMQAAVLGAYFVLAVATAEWRLFFRRVAWIVVGALAILAPVAVYFAAQGALGRMLDAVLVYNFLYSERSVLPNLLAGVRIAADSLGWFVLLPAVVGYVLALFLVRRSALKTVPGQFLLLVIIGLPLEIVLSTLSGRNYEHYFILWAPHLGLLGGHAVYEISRRFLPKIDRYAGLIAVGLLIFMMLDKSVIWKGYMETLTIAWTSPQVEPDYIHPVAAYIRANTGPEDKVLVWGVRPVINFMSGREAPATFLPYPLIYVKSDLTYRWADEFLAQFTSVPPVMIVDMIEPEELELIPSLDPELRNMLKPRKTVLAPNVNEVLRFIEQNYIRVGEVDGYAVYRLKTEQP